MCQHKMWVFIWHVSQVWCRNIPKYTSMKPQERVKILMDLIVHAVNLHLIRTQVHHRHTFPYLLLYLSESLHVLKLTDHPALYFHENVSYFKAVVCSWSESNAHISWKRPVTQGCSETQKSLYCFGFCISWNRSRLPADAFVLWAPQIQLLFHARHFTLLF